MNDEFISDQSERPRHELVRVEREMGNHTSDEWYCPTCGRRFIIEYPPRYKKIVLAEGDPHAAHSGGKGGIKMDPAQVFEIDPRLSIWQEWMDSVNFERHWEDRY